MGKHFLTRLSETEKMARDVITKKFSAEAQPAVRAFYRHPETQAAFQILLGRKITVTSRLVYVLLRFPLRVRIFSKITGGMYPKELRDPKGLRSLADQAWDLAFELDKIEVLYNFAPHAEGEFADRVKARFPSHVVSEVADVSEGLRSVSRVLEELAEKGPPTPALYSRLTVGVGKQPNPYVDTFVYQLTRAFRKAYRAPMYQVIAHLLNGALKLPGDKKYNGRKVFEIYRRLQKHARRKKKLTLV